MILIACLAVPASLSADERTRNPPPPASVFVDDLTVSYAQGHETHNSTLHLVDPKLLKGKPMRASMFLNQSAPPGSPASAPPTDCHQLSLDMRHVVPPPDWLLSADLTTVHTVYVGLFVDGFWRWNWPNTKIVTNDPVLTPRVYEALRQLKAFLTPIRNAALYQANVNLMVAHVYFMDDDLPKYLPTEEWYLLGDLRHYVSAAYRMRGAPTVNGVANGTTCGDVGWAQDQYSFAIDVGNLDPAAPVRDYRKDTSHEMFHDFLGLAHKQCYVDEDGNPLDRIYEVGCYEGPSVCPPCEELSVMSYGAWGCCEPANPAEWDGHTPQRLQIGLPFDPMVRIAMYRATQFQDQCLDAPAYFQDLVALWSHPDSDGDLIPDTADNCPLTANEYQLDSDDDHIGDACDACQVNRPARRAWLLLLVPPFLILRRRRR